jgi:ATP-binding cassette subfamily F protein 2
MEDMMVDNPDSPFLDDLFERIESMDASMFQARAGSILHGLGFTAELMKKKTSDLSGGWRMRGILFSLIS